MRIAERMKVNVLEMKCLRSLVGVSRMDEEVRRRDRKATVLASKEDQRVVRGFTHVERKWIGTVWPVGC